ncbi:DUF862-domain-containing protein, partial [Rhizodiscina lignyota]
STASKHKPKAKRQASHRSTLSLQKTEVVINVYDLLPPGKLSSILWFFGGSLLHSGVVVNGREYAYGGHDKRGVSGVYWTRPKLEPPGGTFKCEILQGFSFLPEAEIEQVIQEASQKFQGTSYNLLTNNCNHFTSYLCEKLTSKQAPSWLNRAASIGLALPCVVPREWIAPPDHDTADGELLDNDSEDDDEHVAMLRAEQRRIERDREVSSEEQERVSTEPGPALKNAKVRDTSGREMPPAERAP